MDYKAFAAAVEDIDHGCAPCIKRFLDKLVPIFNDTQRGLVGQWFNLSKYPMSGVFLPTDNDAIRRRKDWGIR